MPINAELFTKLQKCTWAANVGLAEPMAATSGTLDEIASQIDSDADTLATLLLAKVEMSDFTNARLEWYLRGRIPFGYVGHFPSGTWRIL
jgi:hypothetical protein